MDLVSFPQTSPDVFIGKCRRCWWWLRRAMAMEFHSSVMASRLELSDLSWLVFRVVTRALWSSSNICAPLFVCLQKERVWSDSLSHICGLSGKLCLQKGPNEDTICPTFSTHEVMDDVLAVLPLHDDRVDEVLVLWSWAHLWGLKFVSSWNIVLVMMRLCFVQKLGAWGHCHWCVRLNFS